MQLMGTAGDQVSSLTIISYILADMSPRVRAVVFGIHDRILKLLPVGTYYSMGTCHRPYLLNIGDLSRTPRMRFTGINPKACLDPLYHSASAV